MKYIKNIKDFDLEKWWKSFSKKIEKEDLIILFTIFLFGLINYLNKEDEELNLKSKCHTKEDVLEAKRIRNHKYNKI